MAECFDRWFDICQLADYLLEEKERTGITPEVSSQEVYVLVRHLPEEREILERLENKVGGAQNLTYLFAAASSGPGGKSEARKLLKQFDDMLPTASYASPEVHAYTQKTSLHLLEDDCLDDDPLDDIDEQTVLDHNSSGLDFEHLYRVAREQKESPVYDTEVVKFPEN
ncbi:hypothetical protein GOV10_02170 [Candidatus Woesearchaeota archaeon]|nr:hypothetical protein [Candidatus Woesearchaeota archaeon]